MSCFIIKDIIIYFPFFLQLIYVAKANEGNWQHSILFEVKNGDILLYVALILVQRVSL